MQVEYGFLVGQRCEVCRRGSGDKVTEEMI